MGGRGERERERERERPYQHSQHVFLVRHDSHTSALRRAEEVGEEHMSTAPVNTQTHTLTHYSGFTVV